MSPPSQGPKGLLQAKYADASASGLKATARADRENQFDFPLTE